jgi:hypothetical protein
MIAEAPGVYSYRRANCAFKLVRIGGAIIVDVIVGTSIVVSRGTVVTFGCFNRNARVVSTGALDTEIKNTRRRIPAEFTLNTLGFIKSVLASCAGTALVRSC